MRFQSERRGARSFYRVSLAALAALLLGLRVIPSDKHREKVEPRWFAWLAKNEQGYGCVSSELPCLWLTNLPGGLKVSAWRVSRPRDRCNRQSESCRFHLRQTNLVHPHV